MRVWFSDSEQWSSPVKPPRSQNYVKPHDARTRAPVYNWFTEGFDTCDLKEAKALLGALAS